MDRRHMRIALPAVALGVAALSLASSGPSAAAAGRVLAEETFSTSGAAWTYDAVVPSGAPVVVRAVTTASGRTVATLHVRGFAPRTTFAVHAHTGTCSSDPLSSAGHYQHEVGGPVDDVNELWLGFTTNPSGNGSAKAAVEWEFRAGEARSVTFHDPSRGGLRVACLPVAF